MIDDAVYHDDYEVWTYCMSHCALEIILTLLFKLYAGSHNILVVIPLSSSVLCGLKVGIVPKCQYESLISTFKTHTVDFS
jgi:hypothetical protein